MASWKENPTHLITQESHVTPKLSIHYLFSGSFQWLNKVVYFMTASTSSLSGSPTANYKQMFVAFKPDPSSSAGVDAYLFAHRVGCSLESQLRCVFTFLSCSLALVLLFFFWSAIPYIRFKLFWHHSWVKMVPSKLPKLTAVWVLGSWQSYDIFLPSSESFYRLRVFGNKIRYRPLKLCSH